MGFLTKRDLVVLGLLAGGMVLPLVTQAAHRGGGGGGQARSSGGGGGASQTLMCEPPEMVDGNNGTTATPGTTATATTSASATSTTPTSTASPTPTATPTGYLIGVASEQTADGVMAAVVYYATAPSGRTPIAGFADVTKISASDSTVALELKSTDQSPFRFDLTVQAAQSGSAWRDATLITADLFSDGTLSNVAYKCRVSRGQ